MVRRTLTLPLPISEPYCVLTLSCRTIQKNIPAGEYLVRVEHIGLHEGHVGKAQFYIECYQLKIESSGTGTPGPTVKFPGAYKASDPGIAFNKWNNPKSYTMPGPKVWSG